jgi:hypothetical protein
MNEEIRRALTLIEEASGGDRRHQLEDVPVQSRRRHCLDRPVRGADDLVSAVVRIGDPAARPARFAGWRLLLIRPPNGSRGNSPRRTSVCGAGPRPGLRQRIHPAHTRHGHPRPADLSWLAMAKWNCRTFDRHTATRVPRPNAGLWRVAPAASPCFVYGDYNQACTHLAFAERCAPAPSTPTAWVLLLPFCSWPGCISNMPGHNFWKGQVTVMVTA